MPIVIASQLKRTVMNNPGNLPQEKDFHDFEEINACADTIIMLHHERSYDDNAPKEELRVIVFQRQRKTREPRNSPSLRLGKGDSDGRKARINT